MQNYPAYSNWPNNNNNQMAQIPQTGQNMQGSSLGLFQVQEGNETMVIRQERSGKHGYRMVKYRVVNGGKTGPILVSTENPKLALDQQERYGEVCPSCGKGILLIDMDCVRNDKQCGQCLIIGPILCCVLLPVISWPFIGGGCCYLRYCRKRLCTSCDAEFPVTCCV